MVDQGRAGSARLERVHDRGEEEPRQQQCRDDVLDVAEDDVGGRDGEREQASAITGTIKGNVNRMSQVSGITMRLIGMTTARIAASATSCAATVENAVSCRGKRTFLIRFALSSSERADVQRADEKRPDREAEEGRAVVRDFRDRKDTENTSV